MENNIINKSLYLKQYDGKIISIEEWYAIYDFVKECFSVNTYANDAIKLKRIYKDSLTEKFEGSEVYNIIVKDLSLTKNKYRLNIQKENKEQVNHPSHYGGAENPYEAIKVINAWELNFELGNTVKYISRAGKKDPNKKIEDLEKAMWYLNYEINKLKQESK
jgi:hypothetical protein